MRTDHMWSKLRRSVIRPAILALALAGGGGGALAEEPMTVDAVVVELIELTPKLTPFTIKYDEAAKTLVFNEEVESSDKSVKGRIGELRARLDRMDAKRIAYRSGSPRFTLTIKNKPIAGQITLHCKANVRCVSRGFNDSVEPPSVVETADESFMIDIFDDSITINQLQRFADLIRHLIVVSNPE